MTPSMMPTTLRAVLVTAGTTIVIFTGVLYVQHERQGWPFNTGEPQSTVGARTGASNRATTAPPAPSPGMDRVPVEIGSPALQEFGIRIEVVGRESLTHQLRAVATVVPDESRISHVHTRVAGWVEQLDVSTTGEMVHAGQPLARIFSQELLSSQTEYLAARRNTVAAGIASAVVAGGRTRLTVLGMTPGEIDAIEQSGEPRRLVTIVAPRSGVVVNRGITVGTSVDASTPLLTIADLSRVWILAEVPEADINGIRVGSLAALDFPGAGRPPFAARVEFVYPTLTERTRTLRVRFSAANQGGALRPGLYGTAVFESAGPLVITVPRDAVVDTGLMQHVYVATDIGFEPRPVSLGLQLADRVEIRAGLAEGERIAATGVFLLDSESRLRATGGAGATGHSHGAPSGQTATPVPATPAAPSPQTPVAPSTPPMPEAAAPESPRVDDPHAGHR
jgi:Cu(I)/Ag(I) efflux system membrane fusion protein